MNLLARLSGALLVGAMAIPVGSAQASADWEHQPLRVDLLPTSALLAKAPGRSGPSARPGGGAAVKRPNASGHHLQTGFQSAGGGLNRGSTKPTGGWSNKVGSDRSRPSLERPAVARSLDRDGAKQLNRDNGREIRRDVNRSVNRDVSRHVNRDWNRTVDINRVNLYPGWARPGWGVARPWNYGWYGGWATPNWGWWGARAAAWGIAGLATAAIINDAVDDAVDDHVSYIVVPNSDYHLLYGTVSPSGSSGVVFDVTAGSTTYQLSADCKQGTLNGQSPTSASEAELLNAACQVAYGAA